MNNLVGSRVDLIATVGRITKDMNGVGRLVLKNVYVDGELVKDHAWVKMTRRIANSEIKAGDLFSATALAYEYMDSSDIKNMKTGFRSLRSIVKL